MGRATKGWACPHDGSNGRQMCSCSLNGLSPIAPAMLLRLKQQGIGVFADRIAKLEGTADGKLEQIHSDSGAAVARSSMFFTTGCHQSSSLSATLGCVRDEKGGIATDPVTEESSVPGLMLREMPPVRSCS